MTEPQRPFWLSWYNEPRMGGFELHSPWWCSGWRMSDDADSIVAAVRATDPDAAREVVRSSYDSPPDAMEFRFVEARDEGWSPYNDRFRPAAWMLEYWPAAPSGEVERSKNT